MKPRTKSQNSIRNSTQIALVSLVFLSVALFSSVFSFNVFAEETKADQITTLGKGDKNNEKEEKNNKQPIVTSEENTITYSLEDGSMEGPYGDGIYGQ